jgi:hypothetical protein
MNIFGFLPEKWQPNRKIVAGVSTAIVLIVAAKVVGLSIADMLNIPGWAMAVNFVVAYGVSYMVPEPA